MTATPPRNTCRECGQPHSRKGAFCSDKHKRDWNNRRQQRGAELYDLFMTIRHERDLTKQITEDTGVNPWTLACAIASEWKQQDDHERDGRKSYQAIRPIIDSGKYVRFTAQFLGIDRTGKFGK